MKILKKTVVTVLSTLAESEVFGCHFLIGSYQCMQQCMEYLSLFIDRMYASLSIFRERDKQKLILQQGSEIIDLVFTQLRLSQFLVACAGI